MCAPSAPAAPDYKGAAQEQGAANVQTAITQSQMNNPSVNSPLGSRTFTDTQSQRMFNQSAYDQAMRDYEANRSAFNASGGGGLLGGMTATPPNRESFFTGGEAGRPIMDISLSPDAQRIFDTQMQQGIGMSELGNQSLQQAKASLANPSGVGQLADQSYAAQTARLDPQWNQAQTSEETKLTNQGLRPGGEAYDNAMRVFNQGKNDAYTQARIAAQQTLPLEIAARELPLNELNALRTGSQVQIPQFQQFSGAGLQAPNYQQIAGQQGAWNQGLYNADAAAAGNMQSGLFSLGALGLMAYASDRRLKKNVKRIGTMPSGIPLYEFSYLWDDTSQQPRIGVMADEVLPIKPDAVMEHPSGYLMVDYARL